MMPTLLLSHSAPSLLFDGDPETMHDFSGFSEEMYRLRYDALGTLQMAEPLRLHCSKLGSQCNWTKRTDSRRSPHFAGFFFF